MIHNMPAFKDGSGARAKPESVAKAKMFHGSRGAYGMMPMPLPAVEADVAVETMVGPNEMEMPD